MPRVSTLTERLPMYHPDFRSECKLCGHSPTVIVEGHICPDTELCGVDFFADKRMVDWNLWNEQPESTE